MLCTRYEFEDKGLFHMTWVFRDLYGYGEMSDDDYEKFNNAMEDFSGNLAVPETDDEGMVYLFTENGDRTFSQSLGILENLFNTYFNEEDCGDFKAIRVDIPDHEIQYMDDNQVFIHRDAYERLLSEQHSLDGQTVGDEDDAR